MSVSPPHEGGGKGAKHRTCVKVTDVFGVDPMTVIEVGL